MEVWLIRRSEVAEAPPLPLTWKAYGARSRGPQRQAVLMKIEDLPPNNVPEREYCLH